MRAFLGFGASADQESHRNSECERPSGSPIRRTAHGRARGCVI